jgi:Undecaprenyl-phosphate glucose phosphotransferase
MAVKQIGENKDNFLGKATATLKRKPEKSDLGLERKGVAYSMNIASSLVAVSDALVLLGTGVFICWYYLGFANPIFWDYCLVMVLVTTAVIFVLAQSDLYSGCAVFNPKIHFYKILGVWAVTFMVFLAVAFGLKVSEQFSRVWCFSWFVSSAFLICLERYLCFLLVQRWARAGLLSRKLVIVGAGEQARRFLTQLKNQNEPWISLGGVFDDRKKRIGPSFMGLPVLGNMNDLMDYVRKNRVDDIVITLPWSADKRLLEIIRRLEELPVTVSLCSDLAGFMSLRPSFSSMGGVPMLGVVNKPMNGWGYFLKGVEDKVLGSLLLLILSPVMLLIALAIKLESDGPVLFRQKRHGFNNKEFLVTKFRSMYHGRPPEKGAQQATRNDPRVTRVGAFLRRTSLDELPQLLNVMAGTMSVVGPRPHPIELNEEYCKTINSYFARHRVKPGITGWAQVNGLRGETEDPQKMQARYDYDVHYIENWSVLLDLKILVMTVFVVLSQENAY